jgi:hypothetical protein
MSAQQNAAAQAGYATAVDVANPYNQTASQGYASAPGISAAQNAAALAGYSNAASAANPYNQAANTAYAAAPNLSAAQNAAAQSAYANAPGSVSQYNQSALKGFNNSLTAAEPLNQAAIKGYTGATSAADPYNLAAAQGYASAPSVATPYNQMATSAINNAVGAGAGYNQSAMANYTGGLAASMPYTLGGAQAVNAAPVDAAAINQYLSPFLNDVYKTTLAGQSVQNAQQSSALQGTAAQAGAFGGDRAGIAQANMAYQQNLANSQTNANLLNTGFTNALAAAQNQQNVNLGAQQANRAAQASTGQNIYNQMSNTGQNIAGLGQQAYGQNLGASTALSGLGNQMFGQQTAAAQGVGNIGQQIYGQKIGAAQGLGSMGQQISNQNINAAQGIGNIGQQQFGQQIAGAAGQLAAGNQSYNQALGAAAGQANVGQQVYNQGAQTAAGQLAVGNQGYNQAMGAAAGQANVGNQIFNQNATAAAGNLAVGNQNYNQAMGAAAGQANVGNQVYNQGAQTAAGQLSVGNQNYNQAMGAAQGLGNMAQQTYGQGAATAAGLLGVGNQGYNQALGAAQGLGNMAQQTYGQGAATSAGLLGVGNQNYAQTMGAAQGIGAMGNQAFTQGNQTANSLAGLSNQTFNQQIASAQGLAGVGNQAYSQGAQAAQAALATGQNAFTQGATTAAQQAAIANSLNSMGLNAATTLGSLGGAAQTSALQGGKAQMEAGGVQQAIDQMAAEKMQAQYTQSQAFPYTQASWGTNNLATIAGGLTGQTTTQTAPGGFLNARGGAIKPHARASGGLIPNAASEGGTVSMGRAGQGFADGGMPDPYMTNMYNILGSIYPSQNPAPPAGALAPSAPSGGFAPPPNGLPALYNGAQYAGNPFAALLNTASQINPANYASANTAVKPETLAGTTASGYNPSAFMAPKATKEPWWKPPEAAKPAAATDATAATGAGLVPGGSEGSMNGTGVGGGDLMGALGLVNGDAFAGAKGAYSGLLSNILDAVPSNPLGGLLGSAGRGLMDLLGFGNPTIQGNPAPTAPGPISKENLPAPTKDDTVAPGPDEDQVASANTTIQGNPAPTAPGPISKENLPALTEDDTVDPGLDPVPGPGRDASTEVENSSGGGGGGGGGGGNSEGGGGNSEGGGEHEGGSNAYRGGLIRAHRREGGPVRKHYATSGSVGIADSLYSSDPNSYGYIFGQGTSPASLDQNSYGSAAMNARMGERQQSALQQLAGLGSTLGGLKSGVGVIGDLLGGIASIAGFEQGGRVGRAGGGLVGRHGYALDGEVTDMMPGTYPADLNDPAERAKYLAVPDPEVIKAAMRLGNQAPAAVNPALTAVPVAPGPSMANQSNQDLNYWKNINKMKNIADITQNSNLGWLRGQNMPFPTQDLSNEQKDRAWKTNEYPELQKIDISAPLAGERNGDTVSSLGGQEPEKNAAMARALAIAQTPATSAPYMNSDYPDAPVSRADVPGGLVPPGHESPREGSTGYRPDAAQSVASPSAPPNRGGVAPPHIAEIIGQNTGVNAPSGSGLNVPGLLGGNGGANAATGASNTGGMGGVGSAVALNANAKPEGGVVPAKDSSLWSRIANVISPDTSSEAPKGSWIDRNKGLLDILSLVGGGLAGMTGKRSLMGLVAGGISGAGAASQAVQKGIADRAKTEAETANMPARLAVDTRTQDQALLTSLLQKRSMFALAPGPELDLLNQQINTLIAKIGSQATPGTPTAIMPTGQTQPSAAPGVSGAGMAMAGADPTRHNVSTAFTRMIGLESGGRQFNEDGSVYKNAKSGATGISQVLPSTGPEAAKLAGLEWNPTRFEKDQDYNYALGEAYYKNLVQKYGNTHTAAAAYNAGPGRVDDAMAKAQREGGHFIDYLPDETKNYYTRVGGGAPRQPAPNGVVQAAAGAAQPAAQQGNAEVPPHIRTAITALTPVVGNNSALASHAQYAPTPDVAAAVLAAQKVGYNKATDPAELTAQANQLAANGNVQQAIHFYDAAREESNRLSTHGIFLGRDGIMHELPGWKEAAAAKVGTATAAINLTNANSEYFNKTVPAETQKRQSDKVLLDQARNVVSRYDTSGGQRLQDIKSTIGSYGKLIGAELPSSIAQAKSANEILDKISVSLSQNAASTGVGASNTDYSRSLAQKARASGASEPQTNQLILAHMAALSAYKDVYQKEAIETAIRSGGASFDPSRFTVEFDQKHPNLLEALTEQHKKATPVRGIPFDPKASDGTQFVLEPGSFNGKNKDTGAYELNSQPVIVMMKNGKPVLLRDAQ